MKTITASEFKSSFSEVLEQVKAGVGFTVTYGRKKEIVGYFLPQLQRSKPDRKLGIMKAKATAEFKSDYKIIDADLFQ